MIDVPDLRVPQLFYLLNPGRARVIQVFPDLKRATRHRAARLGSKNRRRSSPHSTAMTPPTTSGR